MGVLFWLAVTVAQAAPVTPSVPTGTLVEKVACPSDPTQTYTLYLPAAYTPSRQWPLLFVFDPRGRGTQAAQIFRASAERLGWIIASSNNTMSDGPWEPNRRALAAMWPDVRAAYAVDERRVYAAGFSGGAGVAWVLARSGARIAGIIAAGSPDHSQAERPPKDLAWFGSAGRADFNFLHAKTMDEKLAREGFRQRLELFDGAHQWLPASLAARAMGWLEMLAMKDGLRPPDPTLARQLAKDDAVYARGLEESGAVVDAHRTYQVIKRDYVGLADVAASVARLASLEANESFERARRDQQRTDDRERSRLEDISRGLQRLFLVDLPLPREVIRDLRIDELQRIAEGTSYESASARRLLELMFVQTAFYIWRDFETQKQWHRAALSLEIAKEIHPERPRVWVDLAADYSMSGRKGPAIDALERSLELGFSNASLLEKDPRFAPIRESEEFGRLLEKLSKGLHE